MNSWWWLAPAAAGFALLLTGLVRRYALARSLLDVPNERSSHAAPTPRGGGVAIVLTFLGSLSLLWGMGALPTSVLVGLAGAGCLVALVGFLDDHGHVPARWRLMAHFLGAGWALLWLGGLPPLPIFGFLVDLGWAGHLLAAVLLVWLLNLYNFMDGIDGLAGIEAITVSLGGGLLALWTAPDVEVWILPVLLAAPAAGFLFWNFPSARVFMGDAGSGFLGLMLGALAVQAAGAVPALFWSWMILAGVFVVDSTVTLLRRAARGEKCYEAHRSHAYQYASRCWGSHRKVSLATGAINVLWLFPVAALVAEGMLDGLLGLGLAYAPLVRTAYHYKAGARELQDR